MLIELKCVEEGHTDKRWHLNLDGHVAVLTTLTGEEVASFPQADALKRFKLPSLIDDQKHFAIAFDEQTVRFALDPGSINKIESFLYRPIPVARPVAKPAADVAAAAAQLAGASTSGVSAPVKAIVGVLGLAFAALQIVGFIKLRAHGEMRPIFIPILIAGVALGLLVSALCFRSISRGKARPSVEGEAA